MEAVSHTQEFGLCYGWGGEQAAEIDTPKQRSHKGRVAFEGWGANGALSVERRCGVCPWIAAVDREGTGEAQ